MSKTISEEELRSYYTKYENGASLRSLGLEAGVDYRTVVRGFEKLNLKIHKTKNYRKKNLDVNYFSNIDEQNKAYILGFIFADGNVCNNIWKIKLHRNDRDLLLKMSKILFKEELLYEYDSEPNVSTLQISSKKMCSDLISLGVHPRKTYKEISIPEMPPSLVRHFIRGFFDGDGSAGLYFLSGGVQRNFQFTCTCKPFLEEMQEYFQSEVGLCGGYLGLKPETSSYVKGREVRSKIPCYVLCYRDRSHIQAIYRNLYYKANLYLQRKKDKLYLAGLTPSELEELKYF